MEYKSKIVCIKLNAQSTEFKGTSDPRTFKREIDMDCDAFVVKQISMSGNSDLFVDAYTVYTDITNSEIASITKGQTCAPNTIITKKFPKGNYNFSICDPYSSETNTKQAVSTAFVDQITLILELIKYTESSVKIKN